MLLAAAAVFVLTNTPLLDAQTSSAEPDGAPPAGGTVLPQEPLPQSDAPILRSLRLTGSTLKPREDDASYTTSISGGCFYVTSGDAFTVWNFPIVLPDGAVVDTLRIYYYDTSGSDLTAWFTVYDLYGEIVEEWGVSSIGSSGNGFNDSAQIGHPTDQNVYSYAVNVRPNATGSSLQFCGVRIFYDY